MDGKICRRVGKGSCAFSFISFARPNDRNYYAPAERDANMGFRLVRVLSLMEQIIMSESADHA